MKKTLIILITLFITQLTFGQSVDELMKMWNSEIVRVGDREKIEIDSEIQDIKADTKKLLSLHYSSGTLTVYRQNEVIRKLIKTYIQTDTTFTESYYFLGRWPLFVEIRNSKENFPDKFYFDKSNLLLWIDSDKNEFTVKNEMCNEWWWKLVEAMDKLTIAANSDKQKVNEDEIKLPEPPPITKEDSLKIIELKKQFEKLMKTVPDSLKK